MTFEFEEETKAITVRYVPGIYGVRVGAKVKGYITPKSEKMKELNWPSTSKKKDTCSLKELLKFNKVERKTDTLVFETPCTYCTHLVKVDTKEFGLPQTRNRCYLFVWRPKDGNVFDDAVSSALIFYSKLFMIQFVAHKDFFHCRGTIGKQ